MDGSSLTLRTSPVLSLPLSRGTLQMCHLRRRSWVPKGGSVLGSLPHCYHSPLGISFTTVVQLLAVLISHKKHPKPYLLEASDQWSVPAKCPCHLDAYSLRARTFRHSCAAPPLSGLHHHLLSQHLHSPLARLGPGSVHLPTLPQRPYWFLSPFSPRSLSSPFLWDLFHFSPTALSTLSAPHSLEPVS